MAGGPAGQPTALLQHLDEGNHHVPLVVGCDQCVEGMDGAECVPEGKIGEVAESGGAMDLAVEPDVIAVGIIEDSWHLEGAVESCQEDGSLPFRAALDFYEGQFLLPCLLGGGEDFIERAIPHLGLQVVPGVCDADMGDRQGEGDEGIAIGGWETEVGHDVAFCRCRRVGQVPRQGGVCCKGLVEPGDEIDLEPAITAREGAEGADGALHLAEIREHAHGGLAASASPQGVAGINEYVRCGGSVERVAMQTHAGCGRQFGEHTGFGEFYGVVTRRGGFGAVGEGGGLPGLPGCGCERLHGWDDEEMSAIGGAGAVQASMAEAEELFIPIVITGGVQGPVMEEQGGGFRAEAQHSEWNHRPGEVVATDPGKAAGADEGVDVPPGLPRLHGSLEGARSGPHDALMLPEECPDEAGGRNDRKQEQPEENPGQPPPPVGLWAAHCGVIMFCDAGHGSGLLAQGTISRAVPGCECG